jgi:hypothetical protein
MLSRLVQVLHSLPEERRVVFTGWLQDLDLDKLTMVVGGVQVLLSSEVKKLLPGPDFEKIDTKAVTMCILASCRLL